VFALGWHAAAQPPAPFETEKKSITCVEVEVRSGPSSHADYYPTSKLKHGDVVEVVKNQPAQNGWLAVRPPKGSFSWIDARFVNQIDSKTGVVIAEDTPVLVGSGLTDKPPSIRPVRLRRGAQVVILGEPLKASDGSRWLPIQPHSTEVRYIPADAVAPGSSVPTVASKAATTPGLQPVPGTGSAPSDGDIKDPLFAQAKEAEAQGKVAEAEQLYQKLADQTNDESLKLLCLNRVANLKQASGSGASQANPGAVKLAGQVVPNGAAAPGSPATAAYGPAQAPPTGQWIGPGVLRSTDVVLDGKRLYSFMNAQWQHLEYVVADKGVSFDQLGNRKVQLYGRFQSRPECGPSSRYLLVTHVNPIQ
jgi:hypothetical protein